MTRDEVFDFCAAMPGAFEDYPFGEGVAVFKVGGRMFALVALNDGAGSVSLKCDPDTALDLRERHPCVHPGYHLNKRHWNTVDCDGSLDAGAFEWMIQHSYELVVGTLTAAKRAEIRPAKEPRR